MTDVKALEAQLESVQQGLSLDPNNEQLVKLKGDLQHLIDLTKNLISVRQQGLGVGDQLEENTKEQPDSPLSDPDANIPPPSSSSSSFKAAGTFSTTIAVNDGEENILSPFIVGDSIEVISGDRPYAAVVKELNPDGKEGYAKVWYYEYNTDVVLPLTDFRKIQGEGIHDIDALPFPYKCQAKYVVDQKWYDAEVQSKGHYGYRIIYTKYNHSEEIPPQYLKKYPVKNDGREAYESKEFVIPPNLLILATDTEEEKKRKKKKVKYLKNKFAQKNDELESKAVQSSWQAFINKGVKKHKTGFKKNSMFKAPDTVDGKVGVTNSGSTMTEYGSRKRSFQNLS